MRSGIKTAKQPGDKLFDVPCIRLGDLFARHNISKIDYLSVDTEGVEPMALQTIDYDKVQIDVIEIEERECVCTMIQQQAALIQQQAAL